MVVGKAVDEQAEGKDDGGAAQNVRHQRETGVCGLRGRKSRGKGKGDGDSGDEEKPGKDQVGESPTIPDGVIELGEGGTVAVVDDDHQEDGEAAEDIEREKALMCGDGRGSTHLRIIAGREWKTGELIWALIGQSRCAVRSLPP